MKWDLTETNNDRKRKKPKKNGEGDVLVGWPFPRWQLIGSQTYIAPLYTLLATIDSPFPLKIMWTPKNTHLPWLKMMNVPQSHIIFCNFLLYVLFCFVIYTDTIQNPDAKILSNAGS